MHNAYDVVMHVPVTFAAVLFTVDSTFEVTNAKQWEVLSNTHCVIGTCNYFKPCDFWRPYWGVSSTAVVGTTTYTHLNNYINEILHK